MYTDRQTDISVWMLYIAAKLTIRILHPDALALKDLKLSCKQKFD